MTSLFNALWCLPLSVLSLVCVTFDLLISLIVGALASLGISESALRFLGLFMS